jgi:predicted RNase H-like HicB family nuclease
VPKAITSEFFSLTCVCFNMTLKVVLEQGEDGYIVAHCPALKSCWTQGKTREEAIANIREAIELYLDVPEADIELAEESELVEVTI